MKIAIGTTSKQKIGYLQELLDELVIDAEIIPCDVNSYISEQPITSQETKIGSRNRAKNAMELCGNADFAIGAEFGYHPKPNGDYKMICWSSLIDKNGKMISSKSQSLLLPKPYQDLLKKGEYLCHYVDEINKTVKNELSHHVYKTVDDRKSFIKNSMHFAMLEYFLENEV